MAGKSNKLIPDKTEKKWIPRRKKEQRKKNVRKWFSPTGRVSDERFVITWNNPTFKTLAEVADKLGMTSGSCKVRASKLRRAGVTSLRSFAGTNRGGKKTEKDLRRLNWMAERAATWLKKSDSMIINTVEKDARAYERKKAREARKNGGTDGEPA